MTFLFTNFIIVTVVMSQEQPASNVQIMSRFMHEFRMKMAKLKVKSFYANHLCKKNCLEGKINTNQESCLSECDAWLRGFYEKRREKNPELAQQVLYNIDYKIADLQKNEDIEFQKACATAKMDLTHYLNNLHVEVDHKINQQTKSK